MGWHYFDLFWGSPGTIDRGQQLHKWRYSPYDHGEIYSINSPNCSLKHGKEEFTMFRFEVGSKIDHIIFDSKSHSPDLPLAIKHGNERRVDR